MSQPAIDKGVLYMAHPAFTGRPANAQKRAEFHPLAASPGGSHRLLAADLHTGRPIWEQEISGDVLTAPVISDGVVYFTTFDGTSYALNAADGSVVWVKATAGTSAPVVLRGELYETRKTVARKGNCGGNRARRCQKWRRARQGSAGRQQSGLPETRQWRRRGAVRYGSHHFG